MDLTNKKIVAIEKGSGESAHYFKVGTRKIKEIVEDWKAVSYDFDTIKKQILVYNIVFEYGDVVQLESDSGIMVSYA